MRLSQINALVGKVVKVRVPHRLMKQLKPALLRASGIAEGRIEKIQIDGRMPKCRISFGNAGTFLIRAADVVA